MMDRQAILKNMDGKLDESLLGRVKPWLLREDTRLVANRTAKVSVSEALRLWTTRLKNVHITGQKLHGAQGLVDQLRNLAPQRKLEHFAFIGPDTAAHLFFELRPTHGFVGAVVVNLGDARTAVE